MLGLLYTCQLCGLRDVVVEIPYRKLGDDVVAWMESEVQPAVGADHARRSPDCRPATLTNVTIPMPEGTQWIGGPVCQ